MDSLSSPHFTLLVAFLVCLLFCFFFYLYNRPLLALALFASFLNNPGISLLLFIVVSVCGTNGIHMVYNLSIIIYVSKTKLLSSLVFISHANYILTYYAVFEDAYLNRL